MLKLLKVEIEKNRAFKPNLSLESYFIAKKYLNNLISIDFSPGGYYREIWIRDSFFIGDFLICEGDSSTSLKLIDLIYRNQINSCSFVLYGKGSPHTNFKVKRAKKELKDFIGGFPTYIGQALEVYGRYPDIDSTCYSIALLSRFVEEFKSKRVAERYWKNVETSLKYLDSRDIDGDGLPEQFHNEDWGDTLMRCGKVSYTIGSYLLALKSALRIAEFLGLTKKIEELSHRFSDAKKQAIRYLWRDDHFVDYVDLSGKIVDRPSQDSILLLLCGIDKSRASKHLKYLTKKLSFKGHIMNITGVKKTAPLYVPRFIYQNSAIWPWLTGLTIRALNVYGFKLKARKLLERIFPYMFFEWFSPLFTRLSGSYPFKTGASSILSIAKFFLTKAHRSLHG